jgi:hypothetical protein
MIAMTPINIVLVVWVLLCLAVAYAAGCKWKSSKFWKWADPIYYPLAIAGIALLFFSNESARTVADLRDRLADIDEQIAHHRTERPPADIGETGAASIAKSYQLLMAKVDAVARCDRILDFEGKCFLQQKHVEAIKEGFQGFEEPKNPKQDSATAKQVSDFCGRGRRMVDALSRNIGGTGSIVFPKLSSALNEQKSATSPEAIAKVKSDLQGDLLHAGLEYHAKFTDDTAIWVYRQWQADVSFAELLFDALAICARVPNDIVSKLEKGETWTAVQAKLEASKQATDDKITSIQKAGPVTVLQWIVGFVLSRLWPFVLVLALALKFAKGIAAL